MTTTTSLAPTSTNRPKARRELSLLDNPVLISTVLDMIGKEDKETGCHAWLGPLSGKYPVVWYKGPEFPKGINISVRRLLYLHHYRECSPRNIVMVCGNPSCVNPSHMSQGPISELCLQSLALKDGVAIKGGPSILEPQQVALIRRLYESGSVSQGELAALHDVSKSTISAAVRGRTWYV